MRWLNKEEDVTHQMQPSQLLRALAQPSQPGPSSALPRTGAGRIHSEKLFSNFTDVVRGGTVGTSCPGPFLGAMSTLKQEHAVSLALCSVLPTDGPWATRTAPERMAPCDTLQAPEGAASGLNEPIFLNTTLEEVLVNGKLGKMNREVVAPFRQA